MLTTLARRHVPVQAMVLQYTDSHITGTVLYVYRNTGARSCSHCCNGKGTCSVCLHPCLSNTQSACAILYCHLLPAWLHIIPHYLINGTIFLGEKGGNYSTQNIFWSSLQLLSKTFLILKRIQRDAITNIQRLSCNVPDILVWFYWNLKFLARFLKNIKIPNFMHICPMR